MKNSHLFKDVGYRTLHFEEKTCSFVECLLYKLVNVKQRGIKSLLTVRKKLHILKENII